MSILSFSLKKDGGHQLAPNFFAREFACNDGSDAFKVDEALVDLLQKIRNHQQAAVIIHSAFRTAAHNSKIGGSVNSQHLYGLAADFHVVGKTHLQVAQYAESLGAGGIGLYHWGVHIDTRSVKSRWQEENNTLLPVSTFGWQSAAPLQPPCTITVEHKTFYVNGLAKTVRAGLLDNENYVHLRDIAAALGITAAYDAATRQVSLKK